MYTLGDLCFHPNYDSFRHSPEAFYKDNVMCYCLTIPPAYHIIHTFGAISFAFHRSLHTWSNSLSQLRFSALNLFSSVLDSSPISSFKVCSFFNSSLCSMLFIWKQSNHIIAFAVLSKLLLGFLAVIYTFQSANVLLTQTASPFHFGVQFEITEW